MSNCIEDLMDYNLVKGCFKRKTIRLEIFLVEINVKRDDCTLFVTVVWNSITLGIEKKQ